MKLWRREGDLEVIELSLEERFAEFPNVSKTSSHQDDMESEAKEPEA